MRQTFNKGFLFENKQSRNFVSDCIKTSDVEMQNPIVNDLQGELKALALNMEDLIYLYSKIDLNSDCKDFQAKILKAAQSFYSYFAT